tara:strand:+ start:331 stop:576 length:246 start_codon:yes stop_codon:yes gene_type:complete
MKKILILPLLLTLIAGCSTKDKTFIERRDDCAELVGQKIPVKDFIKKYNLASREGYKEKTIFDEPRLLSGFCSFYRLGNSK